MGRKLLLTVLLGLALLVTVGCVLHYRGDLHIEEEGYTRQIFAMDTVMTLTAYGSGKEEAIEAATREINRLDQILSTGRSESEVSMINAAGKGSVSKETKVILNEALEIYDETDGLFDVSIYPLMELWGFTSGDYYVPSQEEITETLKKVDASRIELRGNYVTLGEGQKIDFGGLAKGYTSDRVMEIFKQYGIENAYVSLGGNVQVLSTKPDGSLWQIGIQDPDSSYGEVLAVISAEDEAVITSGGYERYFEQDGETYIHIMDPRTGAPCESDLDSVTVVSRDGMLADALSTSLYIMGLEEAERFWREHPDEFELLLIDEGGQIFITQGLEGKVRSEKELTLIFR